MYNLQKEVTNYRFWLKQEFPLKAYANYMDLYHQTTGLELSPKVVLPRLQYLKPSVLKKLIKAGFTTDMEEKLTHTGISIPLLSKRGIVSSFLIAFKRRNKPKLMEWYKYTLEDKLCQEKPLVAFNGRMVNKPVGILVDTLENYLKVSNWVQDKNWLVCYLYNKNAVKALKKQSVHFSTLYNLTVKNEHRFAMVGQLKSEETKEFRWNPLNGCQSKLDFLDALKLLAQKL